LQKEIAFIKRLLTWASGTKIDGNYLVDRNPVADFVAPPYKVRMRPLMTYDRYLIVREWATQADPTGRFPLLLTILEGTGFRVTAACSIKVRDVDLTCTAKAPFGQICRRQAYDKMSYQDTWVAISGDVREALVALLKMSQGVGRYPLFPSVRARKSNGTPKPWTRHYASKLLRRTQKLAVEAGELGEEKLERGEFHPFRRKWATERKGHSDVDVAKAGGWGNVRSLKMYQQSDDEGVLAAVLETRKIMEKDA
jgi:integrase